MCDLFNVALTTRMRVFVLYHQMFVVDSVLRDHCRLNDFTVTGSIYAPDGEV